MSQHDMDLANESGAAFRADLNLALVALVGQNSGATEPATTFPYMFWADTANDLLKQRNAADTGWVSVITLSTGKPAASGGMAMSTHSADYTCILGDANTGHVATAASHIFTINASLGYTLGDSILFADDSSGMQTITVSGGSLEWSGYGTTGNRTLGNKGTAVATLISGTKWRISGDVS